MRKSLSLLLIALFISHFSFGWGKVGHGLVAELAFTFLDSNTKATVQKYLGSTTIEQAATWMDEVRSDHSYDYMKSWHYVNIAKGKQYEETKDGNIINALNTAINKLKHRENLSNDDIKVNLMIIFHLAGDLHMPLHVGYEDDKGGNTVQVKYNNNQTNLHRLWDTDIIESEQISTNDCLLQLKKFNKEEIDAIKNTNIEGWIHEPRSLLYKVYDFKDGNIDASYVEKNKPVIETQLLIAGLRLSAVLSEIFKS